MHAAGAGGRGPRPPAACSRAGRDHPYRHRGPGGAFLTARPSSPGALLAGEGALAPSGAEGPCPRARGLRPHAAPDGPPVHGGGAPMSAPLGGRPARRGRSAGIPRVPLCRPPTAPAGQGPGARPAGTVRGRRFSCRELGRPPCPPPIRKEIAGSSLERPPLSGNGPAGPLDSAHLDGQRHGASPAGFLPSAGCVEGTGRPRRSRYVCEMWRPIFPSPEGPPSGIINPCATAADRRAGAGTLRTGYRGWSDRISAPSGTDALNHTNSVYERMCTEE